ncbi:hypothetical protein GUY44_23615 [Pimelobacter simplex]|uniref:Uncharacterized protein n=1 Tax=Nocardioides simplex TaxID=2045 RepID=A0A0A1DNL7_NOCSI|nr:hypothetical protein [Pimelobacter simplex]AIY18237.1 hypothetical protein KR76_18290 [Pimelobacter simplex]MCG8153487.1 hypothetical protein [Pimelobacter simplex]GEB15848.1 hypothetical protein NSI01_41630 [Pimelobacter simplex]SFN11786.1 hypothetical protein SAMN05421671_5255 [Pimelobacter simplex]
MTTVAVFAGAGLVLLVLVVVAGHRTLRNGGAGSSGMADGLGSFIDVFDPARARADRDLKSHDNQGTVTPNPDDDDRPVQVDLSKGVARIRKSL